jgi:uncharacterized membrane protein
MVQNTISHAYDSTFGGAPNIGRAQGAASVAFGLLMAAGAVRRPDWRGLLMALAGSALIARGMTRHCPLTAAIGGAEHKSMAASERARQMRYADAI